VKGRGGEEDSRRRRKASPQREGHPHFIAFFMLYAIISRSRRCQENKILSPPPHTPYLSSQTQERPDHHHADRTTEEVEGEELVVRERTE
jgi:hypothetical protein